MATIFPPVRISRRLSRELGKLEFKDPVTCVYDPLTYARASAEAYLERFAKPGPEALFLGMNPGPYGMVQTGVPFGEVAMARDWLDLERPVKRPKIEHPKRPIQGYACTRSEVSGRRLWGWAEERFGTPEKFFERFFVWNYCPLAFMEESGKNRTPDKLPRIEREPLEAICDEALTALIDWLQPKQLIGIGKFAEARLARVAPDAKVGWILHPSPASPKANRGWAPQAEDDLKRLGVRV